MDIQFRKKTNTTLDSAIALTMVTISGTDSVLIYKYDTITSEIVLPVDIHHNFTTFTIQRRSNVDTTITATDTLQVSYTTYSSLITTDCGAYTYYQNLKVLSTNLKSYQYKAFSTSLIKDPTSSAYAVNFQIYY